MTPAAGYIELQVTTNFSFLQGASHPYEMVLMAKALGYKAIGITDRNSVAGIVRMHVAAKKEDIALQLVVGCRLDFRDFASVLCYPTDRKAYGRLTRLLTEGKRRAPKGQCWLDYADLLAFGEGQIIVAVAPLDIDEATFLPSLRRLQADFADRLYLAASPLYRGKDGRRLAQLNRIAGTLGVPLVATNDVLYHDPNRRRLQDAVTCIREHCTIDNAGLRLEPNAERHLKGPAEMARLFERYPHALSNGLAILERCCFDLDTLRYEYPEEISPNGEPPQSRLERLTWEGAAKKYSDGIPHDYCLQLEKELALIKRRDFAPFFLTVKDIVDYAEHQGILYQGRGSAANSLVCYVLDITAINPRDSNMLFERFISDARKEPPDIDVDFEHERREQVIQHVYDKFGRHRTGLAATVICYRSKGAIREIGKVMGISPDVTGAISSSIWPWGTEEIDDARVREAGLDPDNARLRMALELAHELKGFPRHLSQHPGGFVIARGRLDETVPVENAAMENRTMISWDKDDLDALQMLKVDVLALGMLTCIQKSLELLKAHYGKTVTMDGIMQNPEKAVYDMLCEADSVGVFQVESRAQQTMLPRLRPQKYYDLVIEVAIVRPGPIQGNMVHPYLKRRDGEPVTYPKEELKEVLDKTLGVPLFQEQCMQIAITAAKFSPTEADELRRAMATFRHVGIIDKFEQKFVSQMVANGYELDYAERCFSQIKGFGTYGFPESHAASFALLVYVSAWIKHFHPDVFCCAILNSQPMGFYAPAQLVRDAREHGVEIRPIDINYSRWDHTLEPLLGQERHAVRLGFRLVLGFGKNEAAALVNNRGAGYVSIADLARRSEVRASSLRALANANAMSSLAMDRRETDWIMGGLADEPLPLFAAARALPDAALPASLPKIGESAAVAEDYAMTRLSLRNHPMAFFRSRLAARRMVRTIDLKTIPIGRRVTVAGLVLFRQRPGTAKGTIFITIEDETGSANLIVWHNVSQQFRRAVYGAKLLTCIGLLQREKGVIHVVAETLEDNTQWLRELYDDDAGERLQPPETRMRLKSRDFR